MTKFTDDLKINPADFKALQTLDFYDAPLSGFGIYRGENIYYGWDVDDVESDEEANDFPRKFSLRRYEDRYTQEEVTNLVYEDIQNLLILGWFTENEVSIWADSWYEV